MPADKKAYLWHLSNERWEAAMEVIDYDDETPKTIKAVHEKFIRKHKSGHKNGGKIHKKNGRMGKRQEEDK